MERVGGESGFVAMVVETRRARRASVSGSVSVGVGVRRGIRLGMNGWLGGMVGSLVLWSVAAQRGLRCGWMGVVNVPVFISLM